MSVTLQATLLAKSYALPLFAGVSLQARSEQKIALIGDNGSGKSTLLKILAGLDNPDTGSFNWSKDAKVGYLEQEIVNESFVVSGGEQKILKISNLFYGDYNVLLLDEPDNHLDLDHKLWFEKLVADYSGLIIVISHDREFLKTAINTVWQLEEKEVKEYPFGYDKFKELYEQEIGSRQHLWETQEKERVRLAKIVEQFRIKAARNSDLAKQLHSAEKRYDRWVRDMVIKPPQKHELDLELDSPSQHRRKTAIHIKSLHKSYGENRVLTGVNLHVFCKEKIAISSPNGSGKSTLLNIITNKLTPESGHVTIGQGLVIGNYSQEHLEALDENCTMIEELQKSHSFPHYEAIAYLKRFLFNKDQAVSEIRFLSGGQKSRLQLAKFLSTNPDILILDEPTNHLDLRTVLALENFLKEYEGTLILVSHDRRLVGNVVDTVYKLEKGTLAKDP